MSDKYSNFEFWPIKSAKAGNLLANARVLVHGLLRVKFSIINGKNGPFAQLPSDKVEDKSKPNGFAYYPYVSWPERADYDEFQKLAAAEYQKSIGEQGDNSNAGEGSQDTDDGVPFQKEIR